MKKEMTNILTLLLVFVGVVGIIVGSVLSNVNSFGEMSLDDKKTTFVMELEVKEDKVKKCEKNSEMPYLKSEDDKQENNTTHNMKNDIYIDEYNGDIDPSCHIENET